MKLKMFIFCSSKPPSLNGNSRLGLRSRAKFLALFFLMLIWGLFPAYTLAQDFGLHLGIRSDYADSDISSTQVSGKSSFQLGVVGRFEINSRFDFRSGFLYSDRAFEVRTAGQSEAYRLSYFQIPLTPLYKFDDFGGIFAGLNMGLNLSRKCGASNCQEVSSSPLGFQVGASYLFAPNFGFEVFYEQGLTKLAKNLESPRSVSAGLLVTFE